MHKKLLLLILFLLYLAWLTLLTWPDTLTRVVFCDIGQGDAILITRGNTQLLVDGGPDQKVLECLNKHVPWWDRQIEMIVATHADSDHIAGLSSVFKAYRVGSIMINHQSKDTDQYQALLDQIKTEDSIVITSPAAGKRVVVDTGIIATVLWPFESNSLNLAENTSITETTLLAENGTLGTPSVTQDTNANAGSITLYIAIGHRSVMLTGDLEKEGEAALITAGLTNKIDVLKAGHHGSKTSSSLDFLYQLRPEFAIISCGINNRYGHPAPEVISDLAEVGSRVLRTDLLGDITFVSDGQAYWFTF